MEGIDITVTILLTSVLSRVNIISRCLPEDLQVNIEEVKKNIINVLRDFGCNDNCFNDCDVFTFLDKVTLYTELNDISNDLGICVLMTSNNIKLEDALYNIGLIIKKMAEYDSVFRCCYYNNVKKRVLK